MSGTMADDRFQVDGTLVSSTRLLRPLRSFG
jgi:hypothetical protein